MIAKYKLSTHQNLQLNILNSYIIEYAMNKFGHKLTFRCFSKNTQGYTIYFRSHKSSGIVWNLKINLFTSEAYLINERVTNSKLISNFTDSQ